MKTDWRVPGTSMTAAQWVAEERRCRVKGIDLNGNPIYPYAIVWRKGSVYGSRPTHRGAAIIAHRLGAIVEDGDLD